VRYKQIVEQFIGHLDDKAKEVVDRSEHAGCSKLPHYMQRKTGKPLSVPIHADLQTHLEKLASTDVPQKFIAPHMTGLGQGADTG
jgi:hypothetical protein